MEQQSQIHLARIDALRGNVEAALPVLAQLAEAGDDGAAASAAELSAYLWRWDDVIAQAAQLIANPHAVYAGNLFDELVLLLGRAGQETGDWRAIARVADAASQRVEADLRNNPWGFPKTKIEGAQRLLIILNQLGEHALGEGRLEPRGDWNIFRPRPQRPKPDLFDAAMKSKWNRGCSPERRLDFAAMYHLDDETIRLFDLIGGAVRFDQAVAIAKAFLRRGDDAMAWKAVRASWADWAPVDRAQTAPLVLLIDAGLAGLVTRERAIELVHLPRAAFLFEEPAARREE